MSEHWRLGRTYQDGLLPLTEVREGGPEGGSRFVCTASPEDAARIVADRSEVERLRAHASELRKIIEDSASVCTIKGCAHCKWLGFNLGRYESLAALAPRDGGGEACDGIHAWPFALRGPCMRCGEEPGS